MTAGQLLAAAPGDVQWLSYIQEGQEWAAPYLRGHLVRHDTSGWWIVDEFGARVRLSDDDLELLRGTAPDHPILPEVEELGSEEPDEAPLFVDIAAVLAGGITRPQPTLFTRSDGKGLLYPGKVHGLQAEAGDGKTFLAMAAAAQEMENGNAVIYLDWEDEVTLAVSRLTGLGIHGEVLTDLLFYANPELLTADYRKRIISAVEEQAATLVVVDGVADCLAMNGIKERDESEYIPWTWKLTRPLAKAGAAVLMLDHVIKDRESRSGPRGTSAKIGAMHVSFGIKTIQSFSRETPGKISLILEKDRYGEIGAKRSEIAVIQVVQEGEHINITVDPPDRAPGDRRPIQRMRDICKLLAPLPAPGPSATRIKETFGGRPQTTVDALKYLRQEGCVRVNEVGNAQHYTLIKDFRVDDDVDF